MTTVGRAATLESRNPADDSTVGTVGTVKINDVFGGAPGGAAHPRRASGSGYGYGPELLDEMTQTKVAHLGTPGQ